MDNQNFENQITQDSEVVVPQKSKAKKFIIIAAALVVVVSIIVGVVVYTAAKNTPENCIKEYFKAIAAGDYKKKDSLSLKGGEDYYYYERDKFGNKDPMDYDEFCEEASKNDKANMQKTYGDDVRIDFKKVTKEKLTSLALNNIKKEYEWEDIYCIDPEKITEAYKVTVSAVYKGSKEERSFTNHWLVVKYDGEYKVEGAWIDGMY